MKARKTGLYGRLNYAGILCSIAVVGFSAATACATKKYIRETTAPIQAKVDQVGDQTNKNGQEIQQTRTELNSTINGVDDRAQSGISAAKEAALAAQNSAQNAMSKASQNAGEIDRLKGAISELTKPEAKNNPPPPPPPSPSLHTPRRSFTSPEWNVWTENNTDGNPSFEPQNLLRGQPALVVIDLSAFDYSSYGRQSVYSHRTSPSFDKFLDENKMKPKARLRVLIIPDDRYFEPLGSGKNVQLMTIDLAKIRNMQSRGFVSQPPFTVLARQRGEAPFSFIDKRRAVFELQVKRDAGLGNAPIALSFWTDGGMPIDEITFSACIVAKDTDQCETSRRTGGDSLEGVDIGDHGSYPDGAIHLIELDSNHLVGVFRCNTCGWGASDFKTWTLQQGAEGFRDYFVKTILPNIKRASVGGDKAEADEAPAPSEQDDPVAALEAIDNSRKSYNPSVLDGAGDALYGLVFGAGRLSEAETAFRAFVVDRIHGEEAGKSTPSLFVRLLPQQRDHGFIVPAALMRVATTDNRSEFLGFHFRIQTPLELQDYSSSSSCLSKWILLVPPKDLGGNPLADARNEFAGWITTFQSSTKTATVFDDLDRFERWYSPPDNSPTPESDAVLILSHHEDNTLFFDANHSRVFSTQIRREFGSPSVVILGACATASPGAFDFVRQFNSHGVQTIIASSVDVDARMGGQLLHILADELQNNAKDNHYRLDKVFFESLSALRGTPDGYKPPQPWGPRALIFALIGNGNVRLCTP